MPAPKVTDLDREVLPELRKRRRHTVYRIVNERLNTEPVDGDHYFEVLSHESVVLHEMRRIIRRELWDWQVTDGYRKDIFRIIGRHMRRWGETDFSSMQMDRDRDSRTAFDEAV